jgi:hypothetical protein
MGRVMIDFGRHRPVKGGGDSHNVLRLQVFERRLRVLRLLCIHTSQAGQA